MKKIDMYNHVLPSAYFELVKKHSEDAGLLKRLTSLRMLWKVETRAAMPFGKFPDVVPLLERTLGNAPGLIRMSSIHRN